MKPVGRTGLSAGEGSKLLGRSGALLLGAATGLFVFVLYSRTLAPTILHYAYPELFDPAMLQAEIAVLGIAHPSGYPTYMMLTHLFTYLPFGEPAYAANLASAVYGALAVVATYAVGLRLSRSAPAAAVGALALGTCPLFWSQAIIAEVYTLNALFIALVVLVLLVWRERRRDRYLLLAAFLTGLSLTHHLTSGLLVPADLAFVFLVDRGKLLRKSFLLKGAGFFLLGLTPYLYLPVRAAMEAPLTESDPSSPGRFLLLVTGGSYLLKQYMGVEKGAPGAGEVPPRYHPVLQNVADRLTVHGDYLYGQFPVLLLLVGLFGALYLIRTDRPAGLTLGFAFTGWLVHALTYGVENYQVYYISAYVVLGLWVAVGVGAVLRRAEELRLPALPRAVLPLALALAALALPLIGARGSYAAEDRSGDYAGSRAIESVDRNVAPHSTVLHHRSSLWYMVLVEKRRRDLTLMDPFSTSWIRYRDVVWPGGPSSAAEAAKRYGTGDISGVTAAREAARKGRVYLLDQDIFGHVVYRDTFRKAGFEVVPVDRGARLYELVLPGRAPRRGPGTG